MLPIWGAKTHALGFDLPKPAGLSLNYLWQKSDILISDVNIGFNGGPLHNIDELVRFNSTTSETYGLNIRPDVWVFPFLNVYGIFARATSITGVDVSVFIPRINGAEELFSIQTNPTFETMSMGFGLTPTVGFFGGWIALDMNMTWTDVDALDKPVFAFVFDPRIGKSFNFKKKESNLAVWVGGFRLHINRDTGGSLPFDEILPVDEWNEKVVVGQEKVGEAQIELDDWWNDLSPIEQNNPVNIAKKEGNQAKLNLAANVLDGVESAVNTAGNSSIQYELDKRPESMWNFMVGSQFQLNKSWMVRAEYGFLTSRQHFIFGLQYRFGF